jgi:hypothetical protein
MGLFDFFKPKDKMSILGMEFPMCKGKKIWSNTRNTEKYNRRNFYYKLDHMVMQNYIMDIEVNGFYKASPVRYEKENAYIIVEELNNQLHIAFHVKK